MASLEGIHAAWMVLNDLLGALEEKGRFIPDLAYADLRNLKMSIEYLRSFKGDISVQEGADVRLRDDIEVKIQSISKTMMQWAEESNEVEYRKEWETKFHDALQGKTPPPSLDSQVPISDLPREKDVSFFRIKLPEDIPVEIISEIAEDCGVLIHLDGNRHLQISGKKDCVRDTMKRLGELFYGESKMKN